MIRKYLIAFIIILALIATGIVLFTKDTPSKPTSNSDPSKSSPSLAFPTISTQTEWDKRYNMRNPEEEIKNVFINEISQTTGVSPTSNLQAFYFRDDNNKTIDLDIITNSLGFSIKTNIYNLIHKDEYEIFYCPQKTHTNLGIIVYLKAPMETTLSESDYQEVKKYMKEWEPFMLKDLHSVLFPQIDFLSEDLERPLEFKDGKFRYSEITLPNGSKSSINYQTEGSPIIITTSPQCLQQSKGYFFDTEEPYTTE